MRCVVGHDAIHVQDWGLAAASDQKVLACARTEDRVLVSADTDFGALLAQEPWNGSFGDPSAEKPGTPGRRAGCLILGNLDVVADDLDAGCIVVFTEDRIRVRRLPIPPR